MVLGKHRGQPLLHFNPASGCPHWPCRWSKFSAKKLWTLFVVDSKNVPFYVFCNLSCNFHRRDCQNWSPPCPKYWPTFFMVRRRYRLKCIAVVLTSLQFENKSRYGQNSLKKTWLVTLQNCYLHYIFIAKYLWLSCCRWLRNKISLSPCVEKETSLFHSWQKKVLTITGTFVVVLCRYGREIKTCDWNSLTFLESTTNRVRSFFVGNFDHRWGQRGHPEAGNPRRVGLQGDCQHLEHLLIIFR